MQQKVTKAAASVAAAAVAAVLAGTCAWSQSGPSRPERKKPEPCPTAPSAVAAPPVVSSSPAPGAAGPEPGATQPPPLRVVLTAHTRTGADDIVRFHIKADSALAALRGVVVTARLLCAPGGAWFVGRPAATSGRVVAEPRGLTWRLDLGRKAETATFTIQVRPGRRGGPLAGELTTTGPLSNCPQRGNGTEPRDPLCRATVLISGRAVLISGRAPAVTPAPVGRRPLPVTAPGPMPPAVPAVPVPPLPMPSPSTVLSQVNRAPLVVEEPTERVAGAEDAPEVAPPGAAMRSALRSADYSSNDLGGRAFAFLLGGVVFLLIAAVVAGRLLGVSLRQRSSWTGTGE